MVNKQITQRSPMNFLLLKGTVKGNKKFNDKKADRKVKEFIKKSYK